MIGDVRSGLFRFARQIAGGLSRTAGLGLGFWQTFRGSGVWITRGLKFNQTHASRATANRPAPLQAGARSTRRSLRVGAVVSFGGSFVGGLLQLWIAHLAARPTRRGTMSGGNLTQSSIVRSQDARLGTLDHGPCASDHGGYGAGGAGSFGICFVWTPSLFTYQFQVKPCRCSR